MSAKANAPGTRKRSPASFCPRSYFWVFACFCLASCQMLIDADFDKDYSVCEADCSGLGFTCGTYQDACGNTHDCGGCPLGENCESNQCTCVAETCTDKGYECGAFVNRCNQAMDCGTCPSGQYCSNEHACGVNECELQSCNEVGLTTGLAALCGVLVSCDAANACDNCRTGDVCTQTVCCTPRPPQTGTCGHLSDGCGRLTFVSCPGDQVCEDGVCCAPDLSCGPDATCGLNATGCASVSKECPGTCPDGQACARPDQFGNWSCGDCERSCPADARCGADNDDGCGGSIVCAGDCPSDDEVCLTECPPGEKCGTNPFQCCRPSCPPFPTACGNNPDGCGGQIQCPGPCTSGSCTRSSVTGEPAAFECR